jgi:phage baseplate assembly protein W
MASEVIVNVDQIGSADWSVKVGAGPADDTIGQVVTELDDVDQCIGIICTTFQGDDPLRPTFAWDGLGVIDLPADIAIPLIVAGLAAAIELWEPRVQTLSISAAPVNATEELGAHWQITVVWQLVLGGGALSAPQTTVATIPRKS